jgi:hypothetical protein
MSIAQDTAPGSLIQAEIDQRVFDLYDEYCHGPMDAVSPKLVGTMWRSLGAERQRLESIEAELHRLGYRGDEFVPCSATAAGACPRRAGAPPPFRPWGLHALWRRYAHVPCRRMPAGASI